MYTTVRAQENGRDKLFTRISNTTYGLLSVKNHINKKNKIISLLYAV